MNLTGVWKNFEDFKYTAELRGGKVWSAACLGSTFHVALGCKDTKETVIVHAVNICDRTCFGTSSNHSN